MNKPILLLASVLCFSFLSSCVTIQQGEVGVKRKRGIIDQTPVLEGRTRVNPFNTVVFKVPTRTTNLKMTLPLPTKEGLTVDSEISILYHLDPMSVPTLLKEVGRDYERQLIMPVFRSAASDVAARFYAKDLHSGERSTIENDVLIRMNDILMNRGIIMDNVLLKSITLPQGLSSSIEEKLQAEQEAQRMQFVKQQQEADAERRIIEARGEQQVAILEAEGEKRAVELRAEAKANATLIQAEAQAKANRLLSESLSEDILRLRAIEAVQELSTSPNSKLIINPGGDPIWGLGQDLWPAPQIPPSLRSSNR